MSLQFLNVINVNNYEDGKRKPKIILVLKDTEKDEKILSIIENPRMKVYFAKSDLEHNHRYIKKEEVIETEYDYDESFMENVLKDYDRLYMTNYYQQLLSLKYGNTKSDYSLFQEISSSLKNIFESDIGITDYYIGEYLNQIEIDKNIKLTKCYFDIEVDQEFESAFPETEAKCPIIALTCGFYPQNEFYTLLLKDDRNPLAVNFNNNLINMQNEIESRFVDEHKIDNLKINIEVIGDGNLNNSNNEKKLLERFFQLINDVYKPDFIMAWNMRFDVLTIINRINKYLTKKPKENINYSSGWFTPKELKDMYLKKAWYKIDHVNSDPVLREEAFDVTSYSIWIDQMKIYYELRKAFTKEDTYKLDAIAEKELGIHKDEFPEGVKNHIEFPRKAYKEFVEYNIQDVLIQYRLEHKNEDVSKIYYMSVNDKTPICNINKHTVLLKNAFRDFCHKIGYVTGNNINYDETEKSDIKGGYVLNPNLLNNFGINIFEPMKFLHKNVIDMDLSAMYPSIFISFNIDFSTQLGVYETKYLGDENDFIEDLSSNNWVYFGKKYFNLPNTEDILNLIKKEC